VYFANDRAGIYALGYPVASWFRHTARLAEIATVMAGVFVILLIGATLYAPFTQRHNAPLRVLVTEIRTSFYRKLFLFFVLAAIVPVVLLTLAFGAYMGNRFQADVEYEASAVATVARRVFEELAAAERTPDQPMALPNDDMMVWIQQVIEQDVNLYQAAHLAATSQRDLFDSGLLPQRTPASAYRAIVLRRQPAYVAEDRIGAFQYLVAAAPVATSREAVLSVPLALRQREIAQQLEQLNRGMLVAAVVVILFAAGLGASVAGRVSDPVARLTRATRQIAAGRLDVRIVADTADELRRLIDDFNSMAQTLAAQRTELARTNQIKAWAEMARQVAHEIKNPLTPIQLAAEHLQRVHEDRGRPVGPVLDECVSTIVRQVRLLRQIASEFSNFAAQPTARLTAEPVSRLIDDVLEGYRVGGRVELTADIPRDLPEVLVDRTLILRALTNIVENAMQAMPNGGTLRVSAERDPQGVRLAISDSGVGMDAVAVERAFEPYFSTKTAGSGLGLANAKRNIELCGGTIALASQPGAGTTVTIMLAAAPVPAAAADD
jgi:nitrogen fixation/metabolism regulation signal transduction histidine kinase